MKTTLPGLLLWIALPATASAADFSASEMKAWKAYCASELEGDAAFCSCLLEEQVKEIGHDKVKLNLMSMIPDTPGATEAEIEAANAALDKVSEKSFGDTLMLFELSLDTAIGSCEG